MNTWNDIASSLWGEPGAPTVSIAKHAVEHPRDGGLAYSVGLPWGQRATFLQRYQSGETLLVEEFERHYQATLHRPRVRLEAALQDAPGSTFVAAAAIGGLMGLALGRSGGAALIGALAGGMVGLTGVALANAESRPETSRVASEGLREALRSASVLSGAPAVGVPGLVPSADSVGET